MNTAAREPASARRAAGNDGPLALATAVRVLRNSVWGCVGSLLFLASIGFFIASLVLVSVLKEIGQKSFTEPMERIGSYAELFRQARAGGCKVAEDKPSLHEGVTTYLWTVQLPSSEDLTVFRWQHDLNTNTITAMSGPAVMADLELGHISRREAEGNPLYDADDGLARQAIRLGFGQKASTLAPDEAAGTVPASAPEPPLPPLLSPDDARHRGGGTEEDEEAANPCGTQPAPEETAPGDHTEASPPDEGAQGGDGGGNSPGGGGLDEPDPAPGESPGGGDDGAIPVK